MKYFFLIGIMILLACNSNQHKKEKAIENKDDKIFVYPQQIENSHAKELYDSAKWYLYTWNCDVLYKPKSNSSISKPFGELELRFDNLIVKHDTLVLIFNFMDKEQPILSSMMREYKGLITGVAFDTIRKKKIYIVSSNVTITYIGSPHNRYENPLQPEVIKFIKNDKDKLNDWFRKEAKRRKIIE